jgi:ubiquinone/menaquinone biosynthesis C-methylase UbiE
MSDEQHAHARSFGSVAEAYDRGRPTYPLDAARWLTGPRALSVLELGAGTGKLTERLVELGHDVHATEPDPAMLDILARRLPDVRTSQSTAEEIPAGDRTYDVVVCAQAFHWFDHDRALPEIARVLRPGGVLSMVWNQRDDRIPWVRRLGAIIGTQEQLREPALVLDQSPLFGEIESETFTSWQAVNSDSLRDLVLSRSNVAVLDPDARARKLAEVREFYDAYGRGMDGMQLPYSVRCYRAPVLDRPRPGEFRVEERADPTAEPERKSDGGDTEMLLIDFR